MGLTIVAQHETHLLIADGDRYAVIERRQGRFYNCHDGKRDGVPANDLSGVKRILNDNDWTDRQAAQATFDAIAERGAQLAQRML